MITDKILCGPYLHQDIVLSASRRSLINYNGLVQNMVTSASSEGQTNDP